MYGSLGKSMQSLGKLAVYVGVGQSTGTLGQFTAVYRHSRSVYGSLQEVYCESAPV